MNSKCICGNDTLFDYVELDDIGFDHYQYKPLLSSKLYRVCHTCSSIFRLDNKIIQPFNELYSYSSSSCTVANNRLHRIAEFIRSFLPKTAEIHTICDFGSASGSLLSILDKIIPNSVLIGIEIRPPSILNPNICFSTSLSSAMTLNHIDMFIASNSLLYTDYEELTQLIQTPESRPKIVVLAGPNHINRPTQLFYDDVVYNAFEKGLTYLLENNNYTVLTAPQSISRPNEYLLMGILCDTNNSHFNLQHTRPFDIRMSKYMVVENCRKQALTVNPCLETVIFGTSPRRN